MSRTPNTPSQTRLACSSVSPSNIVRRSVNASLPALRFLLWKSERAQRRRAFHRAWVSGRHAAHGRYPAAMAVCSSAKNTFLTYPPRAMARRAAGPTPAACTSSHQGSCGRLKREQHVLGFDATDVLSDGAVAPHHAVTGHHDGQRVVCAGAAHGTHRLRVASRLRDRRVAGGLPVADLRQVREDPTTEAVRELQIQRHVERAASPREGLLDLPGNAVQARRGSPNPRAHVAGAALQDEVMVLARVCDPDQAL